MADLNRCQRRRVRSPVVGWLLLTAHALASCGSSAPPFRVRLEVQVAPLSNENSPIPVTLVAVYDRKLFERFSQMTAKQWYEQRAQLRRDHPGGDAFTEWEWEFVPGYSPPPAFLEIHGQAMGAFIFANYRSPGEHRIRLGPYQRFRINLGEDDVTVSTLDPAEE